MEGSSSTRNPNNTPANEGEDREDANDSTSTAPLHPSSSSAFSPSTLLDDDTPEGPFALVYALDSYGHPEPRSGGTGEILQPLDVEGVEEEEEEEGGRMRADPRTWRDEEEHLNWTDGEGKAHPLYSDSRGDLCYMEDSTHRMLFLPKEVVFKSDALLLRQDMAQLYMGFLEVSITTLLYRRHVYPPKLFEPAQKWGTPCWSSKTRALSSFVGDLVDSVAEDFLEGVTRRIAMSLANSADQVIERFVLEFSSDSTQGSPSLREFESNLRASLAHLDATASTLPSLDFKGQGRFSVLDADRREEASQEVGQQQLSNSTNDSGKTSRSSGKSVILTRRTLVRNTSLLQWNMAIFLEQPT